MKGLLISGLVGAAIGLAVTRPDLIATSNLYAAVFPGSAQREQALDLCFQTNHDFNRLDPAQRDECFHQFSSAAAAATGSRHSQAGLRAANFIDLWQAAGRGHQPQGDVGSTQESAQIVRPAATRLAQ